MGHTIFDLQSPVLGFGLMRLPKVGGDLQDTIDLAKVEPLVDRFIEQGGWYFDTAWAYDKGLSEDALKRTVVQRYPRESFWVTNKLPTFALGKPEDMQERFQTSLDRCGLEYFDLYLIHNLTRGLAKLADDMGCWDFVKQLKAEGKIRHFGFSFHDTADVLEDILAAHPECEVVQLQLNYADWDDAVAQSRECYEVARKHGVPIIVMEPLKGGGLATIDDETAAPLRAARPDDALPVWAFRFLASHEGIVAVLSGMNAMDQVEGNMAAFASLEPLSADEMALVEGVAAKLHESPTLGCTQCGYCLEGCPSNLNIPMLIDNLNGYRRFGSADSARHFYRLWVRGRGVPADCTECGACESICPQHLPIIEAMAELAEVFGDEHYE